MENALERARRIINATDREMARLFERRMEAVEEVSRYKQEHGLPVLDAGREQQVLSRNAAYIENPAFAAAYTRFLTGVMAVSRAYQVGRRAAPNALLVQVASGTCPVYIENGALQRAGRLFALNRRVLVVTDEGVPPQYSQAVAAQCGEARVLTLPQGESAKTLAAAETIWKTMLEAGFTREDCAVAVGGGVVSDITGFAAACYMRGIDFYNIPTTVLAQADACVGGKTAVNMQGIKNTVGAFYQPRGVLIDPAVHATLAPRQFRSGVAEIIKMAAIGDEPLFELLEKAPADTLPPEALTMAVADKIRVVEQDEKENGLRRILNFGHTVGHAVESVGGLLHGESVAIGMGYLCAPAAKARLLPLLKKYRLPTATDVRPAALYEALCHDKKAAADGINAVVVPAIGRCEIRNIPLPQWKRILEQGGIEP